MNRHEDVERGLLFMQELGVLEIRPDSFDADGRLHDEVHIRYVPDLDTALERLATVGEAEASAVRLRVNRRLRKSGGAV